MSANETVSNVVLAELRRRNMSRAELGRLLGRERGWITHKLNGHRRWSVDDLDLLAERLELPVAALLMTPAAVRGEVVALHTGQYGARIRSVYRNVPGWRNATTGAAA